MTEDKAGRPFGNHGGDPLAVMYLVAAFLMAAGAILVVVLMFSAGDSPAQGDGAGVWIPGSGPGWTPLEIERPNFDPPGVVQIDSTHYVVVMASYNWVFRPNEVRVPVGAEVTFRVRSEEDYHGIAIIGTPVFLSFQQNEESEATHTFTEAGEYPWVCAEYCGAGHPYMTGMVIVE
jgi:cytochrome c oxidase subunit 2